MVDEDVTGWLVLGRRHPGSGHNRQKYPLTVYSEDFQWMWNLPATLMDVDAWMQVGTRNMAGGGPLQDHYSRI